MIYIHIYIFAERMSAGNQAKGGDAQPERKKQSILGGRHCTIYWTLDTGQ